jgi:photosystem II stability/assembly factor-like uncharacterized protein
MTPHRLFIGTIGEGIFRSDDAGGSFKRAADGMFVECHVRALVVHPKDHRVLYLGSEQGLFRSDNGADSWQRIESPLNGKQIWSILLSPHRPETIFAGTCPSRVFRSDDGGKSWVEPAIEAMQECPRIIHTRVTTLSADPADAEMFWTGVEIDALRRSRDGGRTWQAFGKGLSSKDIHALVTVVGKDRSRRLIASTNNDVNLSTDDGETWQPLGLGKVMPSPYFRALAQPVGRPETILLGNGDAPPGWIGAIGISTDAGRTWRTAKMPGPANSTIWNFAVHPADPSMIYANSVSGEVYRSFDTGETWEKLGKEFGEIRAIAWTPK